MGSRRSSLHIARMSHHIWYDTFQRIWRSSRTASSPRRQRFVTKGVTQFNVKWAGYESKHNTREPIEILAGCESVISLFAAFNTD
jgi:hypothetical protein